MEGDHAKAREVTGEGRLRWGDPGVLAEEVGGALLVFALGHVASLPAHILVGAPNSKMGYRVLCP